MDRTHLVPDRRVPPVILLVELDDLHDRLGVLLLLRFGDTALLQQLLPLLRQASELARGGVEADMGEVDGVVGSADLWPLGGIEEVRHECEHTLLGLCGRAAPAAAAGGTDCGRGAGGIRGRGERGEIVVGGVLSGGLHLRGVGGDFGGVDVVRDVGGGEDGIGEAMSGDAALGGVDVVQGGRVGPRRARRGRAGRHGGVDAERVAVDGGLPARRGLLKRVADPRGRAGAVLGERRGRGRGAGGGEGVGVGVGGGGVEVGLVEQVVVLLDRLARRAVVFDGDFRVAAVGRRRRMEWPWVHRALRRRHRRNPGRTL